jgi:hypothetical protein
MAGAQMVAGGRRAETLALAEKLLEMVLVRPLLGQISADLAQGGRRGVKPLACFSVYILAESKML